MYRRGVCYSPACAPHARYLYATALLYCGGWLTWLITIPVTVDMNTYHLFSWWLIVPPVLFTLVHVAFYNYEPINEHQAEMASTGSFERSTCRVALALALSASACVLTVVLMWFCWWRVPVDALRAPMHPEPSASRAPQTSSGWLPSPMPTPRPTFSPTPEPIAPRATSLRSAPSYSLTLSIVLFTLSVFTNYSWRLLRDQSTHDLVFEADDFASHSL